MWELRKKAPPFGQLRNPRFPMDALRDLFTAHAPFALLVGGLLVGTAFGAIVARTNYCAMGSLADIHNFGDYRRFRAWILAATVSLAGTQALAWAGAVDLAKSMYLSSGLNWLGNIAGGVIFGIGMVFAGGCPSRNLARAGGGDLRALFTLIVIGLVAYMAIGGIFAPARSWLEALTTIPTHAQTQGFGDLLALVLPVSPALLRTLAATALVASGLAYAFSDRAFRSSPIHVASGVGVGLCVVAGWAVTGLAFDELASRPSPPISLTYVRPLGDSIEWLQRYTALAVPGFGVASVFGALVGAFIAARSMGRFRIATFSDANDTLRNIGGATLMGIGGVMALGCTVGQSLTGVSTLALGSLLTFVAIVVGGCWGLVLLEKSILAEG